MSVAHNSFVKLPGYVFRHKILQKLQAKIKASRLVVDDRPLRTLHPVITLTGPAIMMQCVLSNRVNSLIHFLHIKYH